MDEESGDSAERQSKEDVLAFSVSDEALEAAAGMAGTIPTGSINIVPPNCC